MSSPAKRIEPIAQTARDFPEAFDEALPALWRGERAAVPGEGARLQGLAQANRRLVAWLQERAPQAVATIDSAAPDRHQPNARAHRPIPGFGGVDGARAGSCQASRASPMARPQPIR